MTRLLALMLIACVPPTYSYADAVDSRSVVLAGSEYSSNNGYSHIGMVTPLAGDTLERGFNLPVFLYLVEYSYSTTQNNRFVTVRAKVPGVSAGLGYQWIVGDTSLGLATSLAYQNTRQTPYIPATGAQGSVVILLPQMHVNYRLTPFTAADFMANYSIGQSAYWSHFRLGQQISNEWRVGPELGLQGGKNYRVSKVGVFAATPIAHGIMLEMNSGIQAAPALPSRVYVGLALSKSL